MSKHGFTLLELLIGISLITIIMAVMAVAFRDAYLSLAIERHRQALLDETRRSVESITELTQSATALLPAYVSTEPQSYTLASGTAILALPAYDAAGAVLTGLIDTVVITPEPTNPMILTVRTFPAPGSRRQAGVKRLTFQLQNLVFRYFLPDVDGDFRDEEITDPLLFATATRLEGDLTTNLTIENHLLTMHLVGGARLRN